MGAETILLMFSGAGGGVGNTITQSDCPPTQLAKFYCTIKPNLAKMHRI